jgi:hypothetical protein
MTQVRHQPAESANGRQISRGGPNESVREQVGSWVSALSRLSAMAAITGVMVILLILVLAVAVALIVRMAV